MPQPASPPVVAPPPAPIVVPLPTTDPLEQRGDFRSFHCRGEFWIIGDREVESGCLEEYRARGYTDVWLTVTRDGGLPGIAPFDYLSDVPAFRARAERFRAAGLRVHPVIGCEDAEAMCRRNHGDFSAWLAAVERFIGATNDIASSYVFGVEIREWASWDESLRMVSTASRVSRLPIVLHFNQEQWGPNSSDPWSGGSERAYWRRVLVLAGGNRVALGYQFKHARVEDSGGGFLSTVADVEADTRALTQRLSQLGVGFIASEYAYRVPDALAIERGAAAIRAASVPIGCMNGCPR